MYHAHNYELMTADKRPQDEYMDGRDWKFETLEHGGEYPDTMPQAIRATDPSGRSCIYLPVTVGGKVVDSKGFVTDSDPDARVIYKGHNNLEEQVESKKKEVTYPHERYSDEWDRAAGLLAMSYCPEIKECRDCGAPCIDGHCCTFCGSVKP